MNLMDLFVKVGVKDEASSQIKKITSAAGNTFKSIAKISGVALTAAATGVAFLTKQAVTAYAGYQQLAGGVETLFGAGGRTLQEYAQKTGLVGDEAIKAYGDLMTAQDTVMRNAADAYKNAGLSANEYMETVTGFSASLIQSLGGDTLKASKVADMAIGDMSDNANKMGTDMAAIQNAYAGFAKQNYTMLDNLKLGYGGTKEEMARLLADAEKFSGVKYDINNLADVYEAIHVIQTELDITGTTAKEAATTISGSFGMVKGAWENLLAGLASPDADLGKLFDNLVESAEIAFNNLKPVILRSLTSIGKLAGKLAPTLAKELPGLMASLLPELITAAEGLLTGLAEALPEIVGVLLDNLPAIASALVNVAVNLFDAIVKVVPELLGKVWNAIDTAISSSSLGERWASIKEAVATAVEGIKEKWDELKTAIGDLKEKLQPLFDKIGEIWQKFKDWEEENHILEVAIDLVGGAIEDVIQFITDLINLGTGVWDMIAGAAEGSAERVDNAWSKVRDTFVDIARILVGSGIANSPAAGVVFSGGGGLIGSFANGGGVGKGHAIGNDYVPYDNYPALLHRGEAVLTAREADAWRRGEGSGRQIVNNFTFNGVSQSDLDYIVGYVNRELVSG